MICLSVCNLKAKKHFFYNNIGFIANGIHVHCNEKLKRSYCLTRVWKIKYEKSTSKREHQNARCRKKKKIHIASVFEYIIYEFDVVVICGRT
jgi:hypothetical protein